MEDFDAFYLRSERAVLERFAARVRSPELAVDLAAETLAAAVLADERDPLAVLELADAQLRRAARTGVVDDSARRALGMEQLPLDLRTLDRVWRLGTDARPDVLKLRCSAAVVPTERRLHADADGSVLPGLRAELGRATRRRGRRRTRRRRLVLSARVAAVLALSLWSLERALSPERPAAAVAATTWLPFAVPHGIEGMFPRTWHLATTPQAPADEHARERFTVSTVLTGDGRPHDRCGALDLLGPEDALVSLGELTEPTLRKRPERFTLRRDPSTEARLRKCLPGARVAAIRFRAGGRSLRALIVLGPRSGADAETVALEILNRVRVIP